MEYDEDTIPNPYGQRNISPRKKLVSVRKYDI
jgi:hypothetical protein